MIASYDRSSWEIELQCSQCGAPISLEETDRLLTCSYCHVRLYLWTPSQFCYCLPALKASSENLIFIPYWRFRGIAYSIIPYEVRQRVLDATLLATAHRMLPTTLGIKPQALKLRFASGETQGIFIKPKMSLQEAVMLIQKQFQGLEGSILNQPPFHRELIGEVGSLIFFPVFVRNGTILDGVLGKVIGPEKDLVPYETSSSPPEHWQIKPISTLCPNCGNSLRGGRESILLFCTTCHVGWNPSSGRLVATKFAVVQAKQDSSVYLPFWRMRVDVKGIELKSYADLARLANLPKMIHSEWEGQEVYFWIPAFRVHSSSFLRLSKQMTLSQPAEKTEAILPDAPLHPVTFPETSAAATLKIHLAYLLTKKKETFPKLHEIAIAPVETVLVFLPFTPIGSELVHPQLRIALQMQTLSL
jgi:DNA-directed RNA polymerase subunit RPC12/RpoP